MLFWKSGSSIFYPPRLSSTLNPSKLLRNLSSHFSSFGSATFRKAATTSTAKHQIFISRTSDPYVNLSIEHFLLQSTLPDSTVLFLYVNSPCVVIGRNQNPWLETDLKLMRDTLVIGREKHRKGENVQLVRRRSGGGTVFHDYGNVNYSVICPTLDFSRGKHAEMVTRVLRRVNPRARVNERHDIVLDQGSLHEDGQRNPVDMHRTRHHHGDTSHPPLKVSGSAYKLTRQRSLHHGTCLLASPNLDVISNYLRSPAKPFMKARGVDSVRSPVGNVYDASRHNSEDVIFAFQVGVAEAFADLYGLDTTGLAQLTDVDDTTSVESSFPYVCGYVEEDVEDIYEIKTGIQELKSLDWIFGQTPQFTVSSHPFEEDDRERPSLQNEFPPSARVCLKVRSGMIASSKISISLNRGLAQAEAEKFGLVLKERSVQEIEMFGDVLKEANIRERGGEIAAISSWLDRIFGKRQ
ncbi:Biotin/lipoate A/B protein ligase [Lobaria immixta]|nr:Biotin/lipoate A/B protein ligase [Lobaria immixta]